MRHLCFVICLLALPLPAVAQHSFSLPPIGAPLPAIGLPAPGMPMLPWQQKPPTWDRPQTPAWETNRPPSWEKGRDRRPQVPGRKGGFGGFYPTIVYVYEPYPVQPEVIIVERPVERIVEVEVPAKVRYPEAAPPPPPAPEPPFVPTGSRTLYVIPGCYVGNVSPMNMTLPANCDLSKLTTFTP